MYRTLVLCVAVPVGIAMAGSVVPQAARAGPAATAAPDLARPPFLQASPPVQTPPNAKQAPPPAAPQSSLVPPPPPSAHSHLTTIWLQQSDTHRGDSFTPSSTNDPYAHKAHVPIPMVGVVIPLQ